LTLCYREGLPAVLRNLSFTISPGEKVGVVGRTGAGKSTLISAILRMVESTSGAISLDDKNTRDIPLRDLRSSITLISQDPILMEGSLR
jgi:ATP-binding cassette subfamily C (CFTR/MRP) protein 1